MDIRGWGGGKRWPQFSLGSEDDLELLTLVRLPFQGLGIQARATTAGWVWGAQRDQRIFSETHTWL